METTKVMSVDVRDEETGDNYRGDFSFRCLLTRRQRMFADQVRRTILGPSPEGSDATNAVHTEAYILGQLSVRVVDAPNWWTNSDSGRDLNGYNVILAVYDAAISVEEAYKKSVNKDSVEASKKLKEKKKPVGEPTVVSDDE